MWFFLIFAIVYCQDCPSVFYLGNLYNQANLFAYSSGYKQIITSVQNAIVFVQAESGTLGQIKLINGQSITYLETENSNIFVGQNNELVVYSLDENNPIKASLNFLGNVQSIYTMNELISIGTNQNEVILWNYELNNILGKAKSLNLKNILINYQILVNQQYDTLIAGTTTDGFSILEYYTKNMYFLLNSFSIDQFTLYQLSTNTISETEFIVTLYTIFGSTLTINSINSQSGTVTLTTSPQINLNLNPIQMYLIQDYIIFFSSSCQYQKYDIKQNTLGNLNSWTSSCPNNIKQLQFSVEDQIIILLLNNPQANEEMIQIYQVDTNLIGTKIRSFYYLPDSISQSYILQSQYILEVGQTSSDIYIYNQWYQLQQIINVNNNNNVAIQIIQQDLILVLYQNGLVVSLSQTSQVCQFAQYQCYSYSIQSQFQQSTVTSYTTQLISQFQYNNVIYVMYALNKEIYCYSFQNNQFSSTPTNSQSMLSNVLQILISTNTIYFLLDNNILYQCQFSISTTSTQLTQYYQFTTIPNVNYISQNSQVQIATNGQQILILQISNQQAYTITNIGVSFKQIQIYDEYLILLLKGSYQIQIYSIFNLLNQNNNPFFILETQFYSQQFNLNLNYILVQFQYSVMFIQITNYFQSTNSACTFTQVYSSNIMSFINTKISLTNFYILYQTIQQLSEVIGKIQINKQNMIWNRIIINQSINNLVSLDIYGISPSQSSLIITEEIKNFKQINLQDLTLILSQEILVLSQILEVSLVNFQLVYNNNQCYYFNLKQIASFLVSSIQINNQVMKHTVFQTENVINIQLKDIQILNSQLQQILSIESNTALYISNLLVQNCECDQQTQIKQMFQYFTLNLRTAQFIDNRLCSSLFNNLIIDNSQSSNININDLTIKNNIITQYIGAAIINCVQSSTFFQNNVFLENIELQNNQYQQSDQVQAFIFQNGLSFQGQDMIFDNSSIQVSSFKLLQINNYTFTNPSQLSINIAEIPHVQINLISFVSGQVYQDGYISIVDVQDYDCSSIQCLIQISNIIMNDITLISESLANTCYGLNIKLSSQFTVNLSYLKFTQLNLQAADSNFVVSSTALYFQGFQSQLFIKNSNFQQISYSLSTSVLILNAQQITLDTINVNQLNSMGSIYYGTQSEKGGFSQISCATFIVKMSTFSQISSYSGSLFLIDMYHVDGIDPLISFVQNKINNIYSFGNGAIYIDNTLNNTIIIFQQNNFTEIYSLKNGGLLYIQEEEQITYPQLNITSLTISNIDTVSPYQFYKQIQFKQNIFANLYSKNGSIIVASLYNVTFQNNNFTHNNITTKPQIFNKEQITQGSLFYLNYCVLIIENFTITEFTSFDSLKNEGQIIYGFKVWIMISQSIFQNIIVKNSNLMYLSLSYLNCNNLILDNIMQNSSSIDQSLIEVYDSALYMFFVYLQSLKCLDYKCVSSGFYIKNSHSYWIGGQCIFNSGNYGGCYYLTLQKQFAYFDSIIFDHNYVNTSGGTILADLQNTSKLAILNCQFENNIAADSGGCLYINSFNQTFDINQIQDNPVISINKSQFINNTAYKYGGALKTLVFNPYIDDEIATFINNTAYVEGDDKSSYPSALFLTAPLDPGMTNQYVYNESLEPVEGYYFIPYSNNGEYFLKYFKSGDTVQYPIRFIMKSSQNQTMYNDKAYLKIYPSGSENYSLGISNSNRGSNEVRFKEGFFTLENLTAIGIPDTEYPFYITSDEIKSISKYKYYFVSNYNYTFFVVFRKCLYGEIWQSFDNQTVCYQCPEGFYSFELATEKDKGQCQVCPLFSKYRIQCFGGAQTNLEAVYWRENITTLQIYKCDPEFSDCIGGKLQDQCGEGYTGRMCQACDYNNNYARDSRQICILCTQVDWPITIILLSSVGIFFYFIMSIFFVAQDVVILCVLPCLNQMLPPLKKIGSNLGQVKDMNSLLKIFLAYYQQISLVSKIVVDIPSQVEDTQDASIFDFSIECPIINVNNYMPMVYINYIIEVLKPVSSMIIFMLIWSIIFRNQKIKRGIYQTATWLIIWLFYLPSFYEKTLQLLNCKNIGDGRYLKPDLNQDCYGTEHFFYTLFISIPCLLFFVVYVPTMLLYHIRNDMIKKDKRLLRKYKYYYINGEFTEKYYYWEFVRLLEKILIQTAIEIFFYDTVYMAESCLIIVLLYGIASFVAQPYGYKRQNFVNVISSFTAFGTIYVALVIATLKNQYTDQSAPIIIFFEVLLALINAIYVLWMGWKLFIVLMPVLFVNIEQIQRKVANIRCLRKIVLNERLRAKILFKQIGQKIIVINLIKKHALANYFKKEQKEKQLFEIEKSIRNRKQTAAQDALNYILRNNQELELKLNGNDQEHNNDYSFSYSELQEPEKQNQ